MNHKRLDSLGSTMETICGTSLLCTTPSVKVSILTGKIWLLGVREGGGAVGRGGGGDILNIPLHITKTYLNNFDPLKPHFYIVKQGFTRVYTFFLISAQKQRLWVLVRTASVRRF